MTRDQENEFNVLKLEYIIAKADGNIGRQKEIAYKVILASTKEYIGKKRCDTTLEKIKKSAIDTLNSLNSENSHTLNDLEITDGPDGLNMDVQMKLTT